MVSCGFKKKIFKIHTNIVNKLRWALNVITWACLVRTPDAGLSEGSKKVFIKQKAKAGVAKNKNKDLARDKNMKQTLKTQNRK